LKASLSGFDEPEDGDFPDPDGWTMQDRIMQAENPRFKTLESFSTWCPSESALGTEILTLSRGHIFGELALQNSKPRAATIECKDIVEVLVVNSKTYRKVLLDLTARAAGSMQAAGIFREVEFFKQLEEQSPGIIDRLSLKVKFESYPAGQIVFRQQDPPGNCYVLLEGKLEVHINKPEVMPPEGETVRRKRFATPRQCEDFVNGMCPTMVEAKKSKWAVQPEDAGKDYRWRTIEGLSSYSQESKLGGIVGTIKPKSVFGELALQNTKPRAATIRCATDCKVIVIDKQRYLKAVAEIVAKLQFFNEFLPGMSKLKYGQTHPSTRFTSRKFPPGYTFIYEGVVMSEPAIYLMQSGTIEFRRYRKSDENPAYVLSKTPLEMNSWKSRCARPLTGIAGSENRLATVPGPSRMGPPTAAPTEDHVGNQAVWDTIVDEGVFCSLPFLPLNTVEPFTVVATTQVEVFHVGGDSALAMPDAVLKVIRKMLLKKMQGRLRQLPSEYYDGRDADLLETFKSTADSFGEMGSSASGFGVTDRQQKRGRRFADFRENFMHDVVEKDQPQAMKSHGNLLRPLSPMRVTFSDDKDGQKGGGVKSKAPPWNDPKRKRASAIAASTATDFKPGSSLKKSFGLSKSKTGYLG